MVILDRSLTSVLQTIKESILKPLAAKVPEIRDKTPGSFCTRQFNTCCFLGWEEGTGVSYIIEDTAALAFHIGVSNMGNGGVA